MSFRSGLAKNWRNCRKDEVSDAEVTGDECTYIKISITYIITYMKIIHHLHPARNHLG